MKKRKKAKTRPSMHLMDNVPIRAGRRTSPSILEVFLEYLEGAGKKFRTERKPSGAIRLYDKKTGYCMCPIVAVWVALGGRKDWRTSALAKRLGLSREMTLRLMAVADNSQKGRASNLLRKRMVSVVGLIEMPRDSVCLTV